MRAEQTTRPRPGFPGDSATHQLCPYWQAAGKHLEAVMALPLVIRQPCSLGAKARRARRREAKWEALQGTRRAPERGWALSTRLSRGWRGVSLLQVPQPTPALRAHHPVASVINFAHRNTTLQMQLQIPANSPYALAA